MVENPEYEIELLYKDINNLLKITKQNEVNIVMCNFNAKMGKERLEDIIGDFDLGERNEGAVL